MYLKVKKINTVPTWVKRSEASVVLEPDLNQTWKIIFQLPFAIKKRLIYNCIMIEKNIEFWQQISFSTIED